MIFFSPVNGSSLTWNDLGEPSAKYHYATFMGKIAQAFNYDDVCMGAFTKCPDTISNNILQIINLLSFKKHDNKLNDISIIPK